MSKEQWGLNFRSACVWTSQILFAYTSWPFENGCWVPTSFGLYKITAFSSIPENLPLNTGAVSSRGGLALFSTYAGMFFPSLCLTGEVEQISREWQRPAGHNQLLWSVLPTLHVNSGKGTTVLALELKGGTKMVLEELQPLWAFSALSPYSRNLLFLLKWALQL